MDASRKIVLDRFKVPTFEGRRITSISSCSIEWVGTQLTYIAVVARGSPIVNIIIFKNNENKMRLLHTFNICKDLATPEDPESTPHQSYQEFPHQVKLSVDCVFLAVTMLNGEVNLIKMPPVLSPLSDDQAKPNTHSESNTKVLEQVGSREGGRLGKKDSHVKVGGDNLLMPSVGPSTSDGTEHGPMILNDLDKFEFQELQLSNILIHTVPARTRKTFVDPYSYDEN